jgi:hypothetical protein
MNRYDEWVKRMKKKNEEKEERTDTNQNSMKGISE